MENKFAVVDFWDTAGQERFSSMHPSYYHQAHACLLVSHSLLPVYKYIYRLERLSLVTGKLLVTQEYPELTHSL